MIFKKNAERLSEKKVKYIGNKIKKNTISHASNRNCHLTFVDFTSQF